MGAGHANSNNRYFARSGLTPGSPKVVNNLVLQLSEGGGHPGRTRENSGELGRTQGELRENPGELAGTPNLNQIGTKYFSSQRQK